MDDQNLVRQKVAEIQHRLQVYEEDFENVTVVVEPIIERGNASEKQLLTVIENYLLSKKFVLEYARSLNRDWGLKTETLNLFIDAALTHVRHEKVLILPRSEFESKINPILKNYYQDGVLVESIIKEKHSPETSNYISEIYTYLNRVASRFRLTKEETEDLVGDTWCIIKEKVDSFYFGSAFKTWCHRILCTTYFQQYRKDTAKKRGGEKKPLSIDGESGPESHVDILEKMPDASAGNPEQSLISKELYQIVSNEIDRFVRRMRATQKGLKPEAIKSDIYKRIFLEQETIKKLAKEKGLDVKILYPIVNKLRRHLRDALQG